MITRAYPQLRWGHDWTRNSSREISTFRNEINALLDFAGGVNVAGDFTHWPNELRVGPFDGVEDSVRRMRCECRRRTGPDREMRITAGSGRRRVALGALSMVLVDSMGVFLFLKSRVV